jgi:hypothetical protein
MVFLFLLKVYISFYIKSVKLIRQKLSIYTHYLITIKMYKIVGVMV